MRLEASLIGAPKIAKTVWVLWEGAGTQMLDVPTGVVEGLEREQLSDVLSFEAEALTMVSSADSAIDGIPQESDAGALPEFRRYWATQILASVRGKMQAAVTRAGARLAGVAHPGGLPRRKFDATAIAESSTPWQRIEIWDQVSVSLQGKKGGTIETRLIRSSPGSDVWTAELPKDSAFTLLGPLAESALPIGADGLPLQPERIEFPSDDAPVEWLRAWAAELSAPKSLGRRVPVVEPMSRVSPYRALIVVGGIAASVALAVCLGHGGILSIQAADLRAKADELEGIRLRLTPKDTSQKEEAQVIADTEKLQPRIRELEQRETALLAEKDRAEKIIAEVASKQNRLGQLQAVHRPAVAELLSALADSERIGNTGEVIVKDVRQESGGELRLSGLCSRSALADKFATNLETRLSKAGWKVGAAQKRLRDDRAAFDFTIVLTPMVLVDTTPAETLKNRNRPGKVVTTAAEPKPQNVIAKTHAEGSHP